MKALIIASIALTMSASAADVFTRDQLLSPEFAQPYPDFKLNPLRYKAEVDMDGDGLKEMILSESVSTGGTGGFVYTLYHAIGRDQFHPVGTFLCGNLAVEPVPGTKPPRLRLWTYRHDSSQSGQLSIHELFPKGQLRTDSIWVFPGDGGTKIGNDILNAIFDHSLQMEKLGNTPAVDK